MANYLRVFAVFVITPLLFSSVVTGNQNTQSSQIAEIRFEGNKVFPSQELVAKIQEFLSAYNRDQKGYNAEIFDFATRRLTDFIRSQGYLQARAGEPKKEITSQGLVITIPLEEGLLYRLGEVEIKGAEYIAPAQVRAMLSLQTGDVANGESIGKWLFEDVKKVYGSMGFIEYMAEPEPVFKKIPENKTEGVVDFTVFIEEGHQFRVRSINVLGSSSANAALPGLLLREGDIYDEQLFEKSISRLNEIGLFQKIDKDKDTNFLTDPEIAVLDIVIKVRDRRFKTEAGAPPPRRAKQKP